MTVTIEAVGYGALGGITETLPAGFAFESSDDGVAIANAADGRERVRFTLLAAPQTVSYVATASSVESDYTFEGTLIDDERGSSDVGGATDVTVDATPGPAPVNVGPLAFDVVPAKAVKGAVVSGLKNPIASSPLEWDVNDKVTGELVSISNDGIVGDFQIRETSAGSGKFQLVVMNSRARTLSGTLPINVAVTYDPDAAVDDDDDNYRQSYWCHKRARLPWRSPRRMVSLASQYRRAQVRALL